VERTGQRGPTWPNKIRPPKPGFDRSIERAFFGVNGCYLRQACNALSSFASRCVRGAAKQ
jgi:hypothetical protein